MTMVSNIWVSVTEDVVIYDGIRIRLVKKIVFCYESLIVITNKIILNMLHVSCTPDMPAIFSVGVRCYKIMYDSICSSGEYSVPINYSVPDNKTHTFPGK